MSEPAREGEGAPMSVERLVERGKAILAWEAAGCSVDRLASLDRRVRHARVTDWPGLRPPGAPEWRADPALWMNGRGPGRYEREIVWPGNRYSDDPQPPPEALR
jgi:hypothetical protein